VVPSSLAIRFTACTASKNPGWCLLPGGTISTMRLVVFSAWPSRATKTSCRVWSSSWSSTLPKMRAWAERRASQPMITTELRDSAMPRVMPVGMLRSTRVSGTTGTSAPAA